MKHATAITLNMKKLLILLITLSPLAFAQPNTHSVTIDTEYNVPISIDWGYGYLDGWGDLTPLITTYIDKNGTISVCSVDTNARETYIYEYTQDLRPIKTIKFSNEFEKLGAFVKDEDGNYYLFFAGRAASKLAESMILVKYDREGEKIKTYKLKANPPSSFDGVKNPFYAGSCRLELSGSMIAVYFARQMFNGHQASYGFILDKDTFERVDRGAATNDNRDGGNSQMPYVSHSFNQYILPVDNGFIFTDQGDVYPRGFDFTLFQKGKYTKRLKAFTFKKGKTYQYTFAQLGGLAKTSGGYIFAGTYEKNTITSNERHNDSRNLFVLTIDDDFTVCSKPIWITGYTDKNNENAANPKIASLEGGRYLLMWEYMTSYDYKTTFMQVIDESGNLLGDMVELPGIRLNINDALRYNRHNGKVYWAVNDGNKSIIVYALEVQ